MIDRVLPLASAVATRMPRRMQVAYGDLSSRILRSSTAYGDLRNTMAEMGSQLCDMARSPAGDADRRLIEFTRALVPYEIDGLALERLGDASDGGYVTALPLRPGSVVLSIGVGHDVSWDLAMADRGARVVMFDPSVSAPPATVPGARFHPLGLGAEAGVPDPDFPTTSLGGIERLAGIEDDMPVVLKIDVEGAEWEALSGLGFDRFDQVLIEMHDLDRLAEHDRSADLLAVAGSLQRTHVAVHVHGNNERPFVRFDDLWFPEVIEATFVNRGLVGAAAPCSRLRRELDVASNPAYVDYDLSGLLRHPGETRA
jgi:hypothetical protein